MIILAIAASLSTIGGVYGAVFWKTTANAPASKDEQSKLQIFKTHMLSVPILADGQVLGYVVTRLQFTADADLIKASSVQPEVFVADEAFRLIYETAPDEIRKGRKQAFKELMAAIIPGANARLGHDIVKDVMVDSWTYLSKQDMMRNNEHSRQ